MKEKDLVKFTKVYIEDNGPITAGNLSEAFSRINKAVGTDFSITDCISILQSWQRTDTSYRITGEDAIDCKVYLPGKEFTIF